MREVGGGRESSREQSLQEASFGHTQHSAPLRGGLTAMKLAATPWDLDSLQCHGVALELRDYRSLRPARMPRRAEWLASMPLGG